MKHFDNFFGPIKRPTRLSMEELIKTKRFKCEYYHRDYFEDFSKKLDMIEQKSGITRAGYEKWLIEQGCQDNAENRTKYLIYLESGP